MPVYKRGKRWHVDVQHRGQRLRRSAGPRATKADAKALEAAIRARLEAGGVGRHYLDDALARLLEESTHLRSYRHLLEHAVQIEPYITDQMLDKAPDIARAYIKDHPELKPATINRRIGLIRRACKLAFTDWDWIEKPIHQKIRLLPEHNRQTTYLTVKQLHAVCKLVSPGVKDAIWFAAYSGLRLGELMRIGPKNVHQGILTLDTHTKSGKPRTVPLPTRIKKIKLPIRATRNQIQAQFREAARKAGCPARFHDLRHTYASLLLQKGASLSAVCELLGHSTIAITKDLYGHLEKSHLEEAVKLLR